MTKKDKISTSSPLAHSLQPSASQVHWYAFYTSPRAEKQVAKRLEEIGVEHYLPLVKTMRVWSDRKKMVEIPLINSYIFVRVPEYKLREINQVYGVSRYISFEGKPGIIPDYQIDNLKLLVNSNEKIETSGEKLAKGDPVEVTHGTLRGLHGELIKISGNDKVVVRIDRLDLNLIVTIKKAFLQKRR